MIRGSSRFMSHCDTFHVKPLRCCAVYFLPCDISCELFFFFFFFFHRGNKVQQEVKARKETWEERFALLQKFSVPILNSA